MVDVTVDGVRVQVDDHATILEAAEAAGVHIPTLCYLKDLNEIGACRVCVVEIEGTDQLVASCNNYVLDGMKVFTNSPKVRKARKTNVEFLLSQHDSECTSCVRSGNCSLQSLANDLDIFELPYEKQLPHMPWDKTFPLIRNNDKCINCLRCIQICSKVQASDVWDLTNRGAHTAVNVQAGRPIAEAPCTLCGQCITHCPTGALSARQDIDPVMDALADPDVFTVVQVAPAVRAAWGEGVGLERDEATPGRMASALRSLGFDRVFDTDFAADLTIMEEGSEFVEFMGSDKPRPMFTSCCPGWVRFVKLHYPQFVDQLSSAKSPHQMMGAVVKNTMREQAEEAGKRLFVVSVMPCVAKKYECGVPQLATEAGPDVDAVLTVREFDRMLRMYRVNCAALPETEFDNPLGLSTGAGTIFGRTGGVMEAALRSAVYLITGENPDFSTCDTTASTPDKPWVSKELDVAGTPVRIAVASGLGNTAKLLDAIEAGEVEFDFVEIMACPGGCVGGGGQPIAFNQELALERAANLNTLDANDTLRYSHENPDIQKLYADWVGKPLSHTAHEWLHTDQQAWDI
ncbi:MAG TPA: hydrogenase [Eggerthellaceae bacterium]|nr:hydrogenase [Eggerthellaceae bacterium]